MRYVSENRTTSIQRRRFLRGAGALLALPSMEILAEKTPGPKEPPLRFVATGLFFGLNPDWFFPEKAGANYTMPDLLSSLQPHRKDFTIFSELDHPGIRAGHDGTHTFLSGVNYKSASAMPDGNLTVDQRIAEMVGNETRFSSLQLGRGTQRGSYLSWSRDAIPKQPIQSIDEIYRQLFLQPNAKEQAITTAKLKQGKSILDMVRADADSFVKTLGNEDREKLDEYFTSVRSVEDRLSRRQAWQDRAKPKVDFTPGGGDTFASAIPLFYDLILLALQTDSTRSITFDICDFAGPSGLSGVDSGYHTLTHHGKSEGRLNQLRVIEKFHVDQHARFLRLLAEAREFDGSRLLDHTVSLFGSGLGNANSHSNRNLPILLAGGGFKHGEHKVLEEKKSEPVPACNLFTTILQRFGIEDETFGTATGTLSRFA